MILYSSGWTYGMRDARHVGRHIGKLDNNGDNIGTEGEDIDMEEHKCQGEHRGHLCVLAGKRRLKEIQDVVQDPKFMCWNCGRVADHAQHVCNPAPFGKEPS